MGVQGLWKLIDAAGKPVPVETLENRILAVDVSIWLHQLVKGFQDSTGGSGANAHLLGFFYRICKLLFFRIKPVFVFDGGVPALKKKTIAARQSNRSKANESLDKIRQDLLKNLLKQHALGKLLGEHVKIPSLLSSKQDNLFFLPPAPSSSQGLETTTAGGEDSNEESDNNGNSSDSSYEQNSPSKKYGDIHSVDVKSAEFKALPADIRHEILSELKETRKQNSWAKIHLIPNEGGDFSSFQMDRLLKRRSVQVGLEEAEKEMGPKAFTVSEIKEILEYQGVDVKEQHSQKLASDSSARIIYSSQKSAEKLSQDKTGCHTRTEELDSSDEDDPLIDALKSNEDMSQEEIFKLIKEEQNKKKELIENRGKMKENVNDFQLEETKNEHKLEPEKIPESMTSNKQKILDNKQVFKLLKESAQKSFLPISKLDKVLENKKRKLNKKKIINKVSSSGPNLSESSSDSDVPDKILKPLSSSSKFKGILSNSDESSQESVDSKLPFKNNLNSAIKNTPEVSSKLSSNSSESDDDFEEVIDDFDKNKNSLSSPNNSKIETSSDKDKNTKNTVSIELNFDDTFSDKDDIFADIFTKSNRETKLNLEKDLDLSRKKIVNNQNNLNVQNKIKETSSVMSSSVTESSKNISLNIKLDEPISDEEDIFSDIFTNEPQSSNLNNQISDKRKQSIINIVNNKSENELIKDVESDKFKTEVIRDVEFEKSKPISDESKGKLNENLKSKTDLIKGMESKSDKFIKELNEDFNFDVPKTEVVKDIKSKKELMEGIKLKFEDNKNNMNIKIDMSGYVNEKETERAVILEELLMTKNKLVKELNCDVDIPDSSELSPVIKSDLHSEEENFDERTTIKSDDILNKNDSLRDINEMIIDNEESLKEKKYFNNDLLVDSKSDDESINNFAEKLETVEQVKQFQSTLERETASLIKEKRTNEKVAASVSEQIRLEAQEMLRMFGIPYLTAPMEAEAQCAFLDACGLTQGTITDDSDIWLFGANNVYKNFFDQKKFVKLFKSSDIRKVYNLGRDELIMLGLLVGSDYTTGLNGVGPVTALEIVAEFPQSEKDLFPPRDRLSRFASDFNQHKLPKKLTKKLLPVQISEGFPSLEVVQAYTNPEVDENKEEFSWGSPDIERIRQYAIDKFGWDPNKTDKTLEPVIDKLKQKKTQLTLHGYFDWAFDGVEGKISTRVQSAIDLLGTSPEKRNKEELEDDPSPEKANKEKSKPIAAKEKSKKVRNKKGLDEAGPSTSYSDTPSTSQGIPNTPNETPSTSQGIPSTSQPYLREEDFISDEAMAEAFAYEDFDEHYYSNSGVSSNPTSSKDKKDLGLVPTLPRVNATIQKLKKGKSLSAKPRTRVARETGVSLTKPYNELEFDAPFGTGETRKRKKVFRTDEEKLKEIEEARAKAARVIAKLKNVQQFHADY